MPRLRRPTPPSQCYVPRVIQPTLTTFPITDRKTHLLPDVACCFALSVCVFIHAIPTSLCRCHLITGSRLTLLGCDLSMFVWYDLQRLTFSDENGDRFIFLFHKVLSCVIYL
jgi:hypothetical protein